MKRNPSLDPKVIVPAAIVIGGLLLFGRKSHAATTTTKTRVTGKCPPFAPLDKDAIVAFVDKLVDGGRTGVDSIASSVARAFYPKKPNGTGYNTIPWPDSPPWDFPQDYDDPAVQCLWDEIRDLLVELEVPDAPPEDPNTPAKIFNRLISTRPVPGHFWKVKEGWVAAKTGDGKDSLLYQALLTVSPQLANSASARIEYLKCITSGPRWNYALYTANYITQRWTKLYSLDGQKTIGRSFSPINDDAIFAIVNGRMPVRTIGQNGEVLDNRGHYGLLWLPPVDPEAAKQGRVTCGHQAWPDGSSSIDPPPELLDQLK